MTIRKKIHIYIYTPNGRKTSTENGKGSGKIYRTKAFSKWNVNRAYNHISKFIRDSLWWFGVKEARNGRSDSFFPEYDAVI